MEKLYVVGGRRKRDFRKFGKQEWHWFEKGLIVEVDPVSGTIQTKVEYESPSDVCASDEEPSILFKAGTLSGEHLYVCTQTEVLVYRVPEFRQVGYVSLPIFNDLHHVRPTEDGHLVVAVTGLDMVVEITPDGHIVREWSVLDKSTWERFSRETDYRKVVTTKPHAAHPNCVFKLVDDWWVTRFEQRDAINLSCPGQKMEIGVERPHDGIVFKDQVYFTTVDGHIVIADPQVDSPEKIINLNEFSSNGHTSLGWCRGLEVIDEDRVLVGFTRLRPTKWQENVGWVKSHFGVKGVARPTRISLYNLKSRRLAWEIELEEAGLHAVFSIHCPKE